MELTFAPRGVLQIDDARIIFRNFRGEGGKFNKEGDRNFALIIPDQEMAEALQEDANKFGAGWNVKIKPPREEGDEPFIYLPVKVKFNDRGPLIYLQSGKNRVKLDEESVAMLDDIDIRSVDLDIRPYDDEINGKPFRAAYLQSMCVVQEIDRFAARFASEEYPEEQELVIRRDKSWKHDIKIAKELLYSESVIKALELEKDPNRRKRILRDARDSIS